MTEQTTLPTLRDRVAALEKLVQILFELNPNARQERARREAEAEQQQRFEEAMRQTKSVAQVHLERHERNILGLASDVKAFKDLLAGRPLATGVGRRTVLSRQLYAAKHMGVDVPHDTQAALECVVALLDAEQAKADAYRAQLAGREPAGV